MSTVRKERLGWDIAAGALVLAVTVIVFASPARPPAATWTLIAVVCAVAAVYAFGARRFVSFRDDPDPSPRASVTLQVLLIALLAVGTSIDPNMLLLQTLVLPLLWMTSRSTAQSIVATLVNAVALALAYAAWGDLTTDALIAGALTAGLSGAFSLALGLWITRIAEWGSERERLLTELTAAQAGLESASREAGATAERARLARDVHDTIAQSLTSIVMLAERSRHDASADTLAVIEAAAREALQEARALVVVESATDPADSLSDALRRLGERFSRETGLPVAVTTSAQAVPRDIQVVLLRCAQEGLANVRKHATADSASLTLLIEEDAVLVVMDDGCGLRGTRLDEHAGFGLSGMRDRLALVGGTLDVHDGETNGTTLTVRVPLPGEEGES